ncbi:MAG: permease [Pseudomonadota bacterium]
MTELALRGWQGLRDFDLRSVWSLVVLIPLLVFALDPENLTTVLQFAANALLSTLPYIVIACVLIAYLKATGAETVIAAAFKGRESRMILFAAVLGGFAPFCSCEVIPFIAGLLAVGAPLSAVMALWLASPLMDPPMFFITAGALGWEFAIAKTIAAVSLGIAGGFFMKVAVANGAFADPLRPRTTGGCGSSCGSKATPFGDRKPVWQFWNEPARVETFRQEGTVNALFLLKWMALAYLLEALLVSYVPASAIAQVVGGEGIGPIILGALVGAPAYLNGYAAAPLVAGLTEQGMSMGAAMAFMIAGGVSSIPAMAAVFSLVKRDVFAAYLGCGIGGAILIGIAFQAYAG